MDRELIQIKFTEEQAEALSDILWDCRDDRPSKELEELIEIIDTARKE